MSKKGVSSATVNRIRELSREDKTTTQIQKQLQKEGLGLRRTVMLIYVREFKGKKPKAEPYKYIPRKYERARMRVTRRRERRLEIERKEKERTYGKQIAVYGLTNGRHRRVQMYGSGKELYQAMMLVGKHPPRSQFLTVSARRLLRYPDYYLDAKNRWDDHPYVKS